MGSTSDKQHSTTLIALATIAARRFVNKGGSHATNNDDAVGISEQNAAVGKAFSAVTDYSAQVEAAGDISQGDWIAVATDGSGRAVVGTRQYNVGWATSSASSGTLVPVRFIERSGGVSFDPQRLVLTGIAAATRRTTTLRIATIGDSTGDTNGATQTDRSVLTLTFAAGGTLGGASPEKFLITTFYPQAQLVANGGIGGSKAADVLARDGLAYSASRRSIDDVIAARPDVVLWRGLSINDFFNTAANDAAFAAQIAATYADHLEGVQRVLAAGIPVIDSGGHGYSGTGWTDPARTRAAIVTLNQMLADYAAQYATVAPGRYIVLSPVGVVSDAAGNIFPSCLLADGHGGHLSLWGQYLWAQQETAAIETLFGKSTGQRYAGYNLLKKSGAGIQNTAAYGGNHQFSKVTNGIPDGLSWGYDAGKTAGVQYAMQVINGQRWATATSTPNATPGNFLAPYFEIDAANFTPAPGDIYGCEFDIFVSDAAGGAAPPINVWYSRFDFTKTAGNTINVDFHQISQLTTLPAIYFAKCWTPPFQFPADTTTFSAVELMAKIGTLDTATALRVGVRGHRMVKLNANINT